MWIDLNQETKHVPQSESQQDEITIPHARQHCRIALAGRVEGTQRPSCWSVRAA
jgi:hypothetical protein